MLYNVLTMRRVCVLITALMFTLTTVLNMYASVVHAAPEPTYEFRGIKDVPLVNDSERYAWVRLAVYVVKYGTIPRSAKPYIALHCYTKTSSGNKPYPCSISLRLQLYECDDACGIVQNVPEGTSNTGSDGFWSTYGDYWYDINRCALAYYTEIDILDFGLHGEHFTSLPNKKSNNYSPGCPS